MKRAASLILLFVLCVTICACSKAPSQNSAGKGDVINTKPVHAPSQATEPNVSEPAHIHEWTDATCTEPKTCKTCGVTDGLATGHTWSEATCTAPKTCKTCGAVDGSAEDHNWSEASCTAPKTCRTCGAVDGFAKEHTWNEATCTAPKTCKVCGMVGSLAKGHNWANATCTKPKTCKTCGTEDGSAKGHSWTNATCTAPKTCVECKITEGLPEGHKFVIKDCVTLETCEKCSAVGTKKGEHQFVNGYCKKCKQVDKSAITVTEPQQLEERTVKYKYKSGGIFYTQTYKPTGVNVEIRSNEDPECPFYVEVTASVDFLHGSYTEWGIGPEKKTTGMSFRNMFIYLVDDSGKIYYPENSYSVRENGAFGSVSPLSVQILDNEIKDVKAKFKLNPGKYTVCFLDGDGEEHWDNLFGL